MNLWWRRPGRLTRWTVCAVFAALYGCAGDGLPLTASTGQFDDIQRNIFDQHCLSAGCHNAQSLAGNMNLSAGASYDQLVNVQPDNAVARSAGLLRVQPFNPGNSFLLTKLTGPGLGEGSRMPMGMDPLSQSDIAMIQAWIADGAPRGSTAGPTVSPSPGPPGTATASNTPTVVATDTPELQPTATATDTSLPATPTATETGTPPTATATAAGSVSSTATPTPTPTESAVPTPTATTALSAFQEIQTTIFNPTCTGAFCHDVQGMSGGLVLVEGQSYDHLVGVPPQNEAALAAGLLRVDPGNPDNSFLLVKLMNPSLLMGSRMPLGKPPLSAEQLELIRGWIADGAPQ